jgi:XRE family transcriptional regulator, aerobic/anaerobic benzoate catabolism transcriptional regulator
MHQNLNSLPAATPLGQLPPTEVEAQDALYLQNLGMRVREARAQRGMSRRVLSRDSRVSERYLAQLEAGQGNISILLLRQISQALDLPIAELLYDGAQQSSELKRAKDFLEKLPAEQLQRARELLAREFVCTDPAARRQRIAIVGLRGAGKSTLGHLLGRHLAVPFIELDRVIEERSGLGLSVIFDLYGQSGFRRLERECLDQVLHQYPKFVLATGGSLVSESATFERLLAECFTIWLRATPEDHMQRVIAQGDTRPMSEDRQAAMSELKIILAVREPLYRRADATIDTSRKSEEATLEELRRTFAEMPASPTNSVIAEEPSVK